jgi:hypothetical protein
MIISFSGEEREIGGVFLMLLIKGRVLFIGCAYFLLLRRLCFVNVHNVVIVDPFVGNM